MASEINDGGPAFPFSEVPGIHSGCSGMTLRDWFAGQVATGMAAYSGTTGIAYGPAEIAGRAYQVADAMLAAREAGDGRI